MFFFTLVFFSFSVVFSFLLDKNKKLSLFLHIKQKQLASNRTINMAEYRISEMQTGPRITGPKPEKIYKPKNRKNDLKTKTRPENLVGLKNLCDYYSYMVKNKSTHC